MFVTLLISALIGFAVSGTISAARVAFDGGSKREILAAFVSSGIVGAVLGMASFAGGAIVALGIQMSQLACFTTGSSNNKFWRGFIVVLRRQKN